MDNNQGNQTPAADPMAPNTMPGSQAPAGPAPVEPAVSPSEAPVNPPAPAGDSGTVVPPVDGTQNPAGGTTPPTTGTGM